LAKKGSNLKSLIAVFVVFSEIGINRFPLPYGIAMCQNRRARKGQSITQGAKQTMRNYSGSNTIKAIGIDLAKSVFHLHGVDEQGKIVVRKRLSRRKLAEFMAQLPPCLVAMEACGSSHYWARKFQTMGHEVRLISPQFVKPYVKSNKNDTAGTEAICEAAQRPNMRFVPLKSIEQQDILSIHRAREQVVRRRTAQGNQMRGLLMEYGINRWKAKTFGNQ